MDFASWVWRGILVRSLAVVLLLAVTRIASAEPAVQVVFEPPLDEFDWVQLTSDEWLKGELIALYEDTLEFDSDNLGVLKLDWDDVRRLRTRGTWGVVVDDAKPVFGVVEVNGEQVIVRTDETEKILDRDRLVSIASGKAPERDLWRATISLGASIRKGNSNVVEYNMRAGTRRLTPASRVMLDYIGNYNRTEGIEVANKHRFTHSWDRYRNTRTFWRPIFGQYFRDPFQNIAHQASLGGGYGWHVVDGPRASLDVSLSAGGQYVWFVSAVPGLPVRDFSPAAGLSVEYDVELTDWLDYFLVYNFYVLNNTAGRFKHHLLSEVSTDVWRDLDFNVSLVWDRTQQPQPRADGSVPLQNDFRLIFGLGWDL